MEQRVVSQLNYTGFKLVNHLKACKSPSQLSQIQAQIILHNLHPNTTMTSHFIATCQSLSLLDTAFCLFRQIQSPHVFICNSIIRAFSHSHSPKTSISVYTQMRRNSIYPNKYTFPFLLKSISDLRFIKQGEMVHTHTIKLGHVSDVFVSNSFLDVYSSCGDMVLCQRLFDEMVKRDVVSWTTMIEGYRNNGKLHDALLAFEMMQFSGVLPNRVTMVNALAACARAGALEMGVWIHDFIRRNGWEVDVVLGTALIDMYGKCGKMIQGHGVFESMKDRNVFTWNALIKGLAMEKNGKDAVSLLYRMELSTVKSDEVTLVGVLNACSHSGLVQQGWDIFNSIIKWKYGFQPNIKHYSCMIDMMARVGSLYEVFKLIQRMPFHPNTVMWGAVLSGCRTHGNLELSQFAARKLVELEPGNGAYYVLLSNLYAEMGKWKDVENVRRLMKERGLVKGLGSSSIELEDPSMQDCELLAA